MHAKCEFRTKLKKKNPKLFFGYIRSKEAVKDNIGPLLDSDDNLVSNNKGMASVLNQTFRKVLTEEKNRVPHQVKTFQ